MQETKIMFGIRTTPCTT